MILFFRYRLQTVRSLAGVSLMLRLLWACLRWDDMAVKPSASVGTTRKGDRTPYTLTCTDLSLKTCKIDFYFCSSTQLSLLAFCQKNIAISKFQISITIFLLTETTDTDITTTEIIKRRDVGPYGIRSEYCIRKIICPLGNRETPKGRDLKLLTRSLTMAHCCKGMVAF